MASILEAIMFESGSQAVAQTGLRITGSLSGTSNTASYLSASGPVVSNGYQVGSSWQTYSTAANYTASAADDGKQIIISNASNVGVQLSTASLSSTFTCNFLQSGSGRLLFTGTGVNVNNRFSFVTSSGQWAIVSVTRVPNGSFLLLGDLAP